MRDIKNREDIEHQVSSFYKKAMNDKEIGFFFTEIAPINLEEHIPRICDFWEGILFNKVLFKGNPMLKHIELNWKSPIKEEHFARWLTLWKETVEDNFRGEKANLAIERSQQIGKLMQLKIASISK